MDQWEPLSLNYAISPITSVCITTLVLFLVSLVYFIKIKKVKPDQAPGKYCLIIGAIINFVKGLVAEVIGKKHTKLTPYFLFAFMWLATSNLIILFGFRETATAMVVPLTFAITTWIGSQVVAIRYQKWSYFNKFLFRIKIGKDKKIPIMINPLEIISKITPIISLTFRMWGNITAGSVIYALIWWAFAGITEPYPQIGIIMISGLIVMPFLLGYFTLFAGVIQAFVFMLLSITYWGQEINEGEEHHAHLAKLKEEKLLKQKEALEQRQNELKKQALSNVQA